MSSSGNVVKSSFIQFSGNNTRVIDSSALVAKRLEGFSGVLRERTEEEENYEPQYDEEGNLIPRDSIDMITGEAAIDESETSGEPEGPSMEEIQASIDGMIEEAKAQASQIIEEANNASEAIRNTAREEGLALGREAAAHELEALKDEINEERNRLIREYDNLASELEPLMVDTITGVFNHVFGEELYSRKDVMMCLINRALMHIESNDQIVIHVCPADYDMLIEKRAALIEKTAFQRAPELVQREDFKKGQAKIETPFGIIDCSIDTELKELVKTLKVLSYEGKN